MPRPKVRPEKRQRVVKACIGCFRSKRKCDASFPCSHCIRRGLADDCHFSPAEKHSENPPLQQVPSEPGHLGQQIPQQSLLASPDNSDAATTQQRRSGVEPSTSALHDASARLLRGSDFSSVSASREQAPNNLRPRMLSTSGGEALFVGRSASLSFLQLVRETVSWTVGATAFSEYPARNRMLEADLNLGADQGVSPIPEIAKQLQYIENYFLATNGLIDVLSREEAQNVIGRTAPSSMGDAAGLLVVAIGAQTLPFSRVDSEVEKASIGCAQQIAFTTMLENPSLDMARIFVLLALYMLGACRRNAAFMYLGVAARAAHALGLHHAESYKVLTEEKRNLRLRCWKSIVSLDIMVSSILGRTPATSPSQSAECGNEADSGYLAAPSSVELDATYQLSITVEHILNEFYAVKTMTVESAESHLRSLRSWSDALPGQLRLSGAQTPATHTQSSLLASLHISSFYYFAVMLVSRPFLISSLTSSLIPSAENNNPVQNDHDNEVADLAAACLSAAMFMVQTSADVFQLGHFLENMCLLKAWIFAAGLVLGFASFASKEQDEEVEEAFQSAQRVLCKFSARSPQAAHYLDILKHLSNAIAKRRELLRSHKRKKVVSFVDRIMDLNPRQTPERTAWQNHERMAEDDPRLQQTFIGGFNLNSQLDPQLVQQDMDMENVLYGWDSTSFSLDEHFPLNPQAIDEMQWNSLWRHCFPSE